MQGVFCETEKSIANLETTRYINSTVLVDYLSNHVDEFGTDYFVDVSYSFMIQRCGVSLMLGQAEERNAKITVTLLRELKEVTSLPLGYKFWDL